MLVSVRLSVAAMMPRLGLSYRHDEPSVLHALEADQPAGELFDFPGFALDDEDFKARFMVKMRMTGRDH